MPLTRECIVISFCDVSGFDHSVEDDNVDPRKGHIIVDEAWGIPIRVYTPYNETNDFNQRHNKCSLGSNFESFLQKILGIVYH